MKKMAVYCNCVVLIFVAVSIFGRVESTNADRRAPANIAKILWPYWSEMRVGK
jgi:hypothetical protein